MWPSMPGRRPMRIGKSHSGSSASGNEVQVSLVARDAMQPHIVRSRPVTATLGATPVAGPSPAGSWTSSGECSRPPVECPQRLLRVESTVPNSRPQTTYPVSRMSQ